tara:strand:- start:805 stop:954 length:150 start_codon:yes stop_codon:yes gene_type:complete
MKKKTRIILLSIASVVAVYLCLSCSIAAPFPLLIEKPEAPVVIEEPEFM